MKSTIYIETLGCAKNTVYSEMLVGTLEDNGYDVVENANEAEIIIINTCGFIDAAKEESISAILEAATLKEIGTCKKIITTGCMVQKYADELKESLPEVDLFVGTTHHNDILDILHSLESDGNDMIDHKWTLPNQRGYLSRKISTPKNYAYLSIAEGCDNRCSYCAIPEMTGPYRSRPIEDIVEEAQHLADIGYQEIILIAQDTTYYGKDLYNKYALSDLLKELCRISNIEWIRILYAYPNNFTDELIDVIAKEDKICNYLDIPFQHANTEVLREMARNITREEIEELIRKLRLNIPNIILRSTFIVGFPGETKEQFEDLLDFLSIQKLERVGIFTYSQEEGTYAGKRTDQISDDIKEERAEFLMDMQYGIMVERHRERIGEEVLVRVEEESEDVVGLLCCRSYAEAPDIDPLILVNKQDADIRIGDFIKIRIVSVDEYDLVGELI